MTTQLGQIVPDFEQNTTRGPVRFHDRLGASSGPPRRRTRRGEAARQAPERAGWRTSEPTLRMVAQPATT